ncbi:MAG: hypothetical protein HC905_21705 [Bacteroidales bacterium]|nr:hypothetical protein [Bacteroidales bacterium]
MATNWKLSVLLTGLVVLAACEKDGPENSNTTQDLEQKNIIVNNNSTQLSSRIKQVDELMRVEEVMIICLKVHRSLLKLISTRIIHLSSGLKLLLRNMKEIP